MEEQEAKDNGQNDATDDPVDAYGGNCHMPFANVKFDAKLLVFWLTAHFAAP